VADRSLTVLRLIFCSYVGIAVGGDVGVVVMYVVDYGDVGGGDDAVRDVDGAGVGVAVVGSIFIIYVDIVVGCVVIVVGIGCVGFDVGIDVVVVMGCRCWCG